MVFFPRQLPSHPMFFSRPSFPLLVHKPEGKSRKKGASVRC